MKETMTTEPMEILRAHGWRMRPAGHFVRRVAGDREMLYPAARGGWRYLCNGGWSRYLGVTLVEAVAALHPTLAPVLAVPVEELRAGVEVLYPEYVPVMEAVR